MLRKDLINRKFQTALKKGLIFLESGNQHTLTIAADDDRARNRDWSMKAVHHHLKMGDWKLIEEPKKDIINYHTSCNPMQQYGQSLVSLVAADFATLETLATAAAALRNQRKALTFAEMYGTSQPINHDWHHFDFRTEGTTTGGFPTKEEIKATSMLKEAADCIGDRASERDTEEERSMASTVRAFNGMYGTELSEEQGWMFMVMLKMSRAKGGEFRADDYVDGAAYFALAGECRGND